MRSALLRLLRLHDATPAERAATLWTGLLFFCVLCSYYLLRPMREEVGAAFGTHNLLKLFALTFVMITVLNPIYLALLGRRPIQRLLPQLLHAFAGSFVLLAVAMLAVPPLQDAVLRFDDLSGLVAAFFYSWVTAFVVCGVAIVWVHAVDHFTTQQGKRLFGLVSVGGTLGAILASGLAVVSAELPRWQILVAAAIALEGGVFCFHRSLQACMLMTGRAPQAVALARGEVWRGLRQMLRSSYLLGIAGFVMLASVVATAFYYSLSDLATHQLASSAQRREMYAQINLWQNLASLLLQVWVTRVAFLRLGIAAVLCTMPLVSLCGIGLVALVPVVSVLAVFEVLRRTLQFAFDKPARELLFTPLSSDAKHGAKAVLDTAVLRCGDLLGAWLNDWLVRLQIGSAQVAMAATPVLCGWGLLGYWLGRRCVAAEAAEPVPTPPPGPASIS
jgi:AAA family ATP:ADP antiporter